MLLAQDIHLTDRQAIKSSAKLDADAASDTALLLHRQVMHSHATALPLRQNKDYTKTSTPLESFYYIHAT